jgi:hypothetical protein
MKYVINLIPENAKVLPDYFVNEATNINKASFVKKFFCTAGAVFLYLMALGSMEYPALSVLFFIMATGLLWPVHRWLEKKLRFTFTSIIKGAVYSFLLLPCVMLMVHYGENIKPSPGAKAEAKIETPTKDNTETSAKASRPEKQPSPPDNSQALRIDSIRKDSLNKDLALLNNPDKITNISVDEIGKRYDHALTLASNTEEKAQVERAVGEARKGSLPRLMKSKKYQDALDILNALVLENANDAAMLYQRAMCYDKLGDTEGAVADLVQAMKLGSTEANKLHEKINPERKRVV